MVVGGGWRGGSSTQEVRRGGDILHLLTFPTLWLPLSHVALQGWPASICWGLGEGVLLPTVASPAHFPTVICWFEL